MSSHATYIARMACTAFASLSMYTYNIHKNSIGAKLRPFFIFFFLLFATFLKRVNRKCMKEASTSGIGIHNTTADNRSCCCCPLDLSSCRLILDFFRLCITLVRIRFNWAIEHFLCWSNLCAIALQIFLSATNFNIHHHSLDVKWIFCLFFSSVHTF